MADVKKAKVDLRQMDEKALQARLAELRAALVVHHKANAAQELPSPAVITKTRKDIAKTLTMLTEVRKANPSTSLRVKEKEK